MSSKALLGGEVLIDRHDEIAQRGQQPVVLPAPIDHVALGLRLGNAIAAACLSGGDIDLLALRAAGEVQGDLRRGSR